MRALTQHVFQLDLLHANAYLIRSPDGLTLVDTAVKGVRPRLERQLSRAGYQLTDIRRILITHAHVDHVGGLAELVQATNAKVWAHRLAAPIIRGDMPAPRPAPDDVSTQDKLIGRLISSFVGGEQPPAPVDRELEDGDILDEVLPGLAVIHLPGHAPGQAGFWLPQNKLLIGGDVMMHLTPRLTRPLGAYTPDMAGADQSILKVASLGVSTLGLGHGAPHIGNAGPAIDRLAAKLSVPPEAK